MDFMQAISSGFQNYVNFSGRAIRSEYWWWILFTVLLAVVASIIDAALGIGILAAIATLGTLLPSLGLAVRRLHDLDKSGWWVLLALIPLIGPIILIVWFCGRGTVGSNRFGPDPLEGRA
jgi:uncharacterized membrane protein YhaH (DUF805 family)